MNFLSYIYNIFFGNVNQVYPRVWLGNRIIALDKDFMVANNIGLVVNCTKEIPFVTDTLSYPDIELDSADSADAADAALKTINTIRIPVDDSLLERDIIAMEHYIGTYLPQIIEAYRQDKQILVHCFAGKQRSAIVVAALLYSIFMETQDKYDNEQLAQHVFSVILAERPQAFTFGYRINFLKTFRRFFKLDTN